VTEAELQEQVRLMCGQLRLYHYHVRNSRGSAPGFPDCFIMNHAGRIIFRELKRESGQLTREQRVIGYALQAGGHDWAVWRPADLRDGSIGAELAALAGHKLRVTA
jgi:hypothetical protein